MSFEIVRVDENNYSLFSDLLYWRANGWEREPTREAAPEELKNPNLHVYCAACEGRFVGWISLVYIPKVSRWKRGHVYVDELWVQPEYRCRGIGTALMECAAELKEALGAVGVRLYVNTKNHDARRLYQKCGLAGEETAWFMEG